MATTEMTRADRAPAGSQDVRSELAHDAGRLKHAAMDRAVQEAETRKGKAAQAARSASSALDKAAEDLRQDGKAPDWLASAFQQAASGIERLAGGVENRSPEQIGREVSLFARQNPTAFLAASVAAGFAAARFLRAGAEYQHHHQDAGVSSGPLSASSTGTMGYESGGVGSGGASAFTGMTHSQSGFAEGGTIR